MATSCYSTGSTAWNTTSTWSCGHVPTCGDTVYIQSGHIVTVGAQNDYTGCGSRMIIDIIGTLQFTNGNKLDLPCGSVVSIQSGGIVKKQGSGGGSSTLISICNNIIWTAADGQLNGPISFGGWILPIELISFELLEIMTKKYV